MPDTVRAVPPPPLAARALLRVAVSRRHHEFLAGDLEETYHDLAARHGLRHARRWYWAQARAALMPSRARTGRTMRHVSLSPSLSSLEGVRSDLRSAVSSLVRAPLFTATAVAMLALGIGVNTTTFSWLNAVLLSPVPGVAEPHRIVQLGTAFRGNVDTSFSYPDYLLFRDLPAFSGVVARSDRPVTIVVPAAGDVASGGGAPERMYSELVSGNFFRVLGVVPSLGRSFLPEEVRGPGDAPVAVISDGLWTRRFARDPHVLGRALLVNGTPVTIVGVAPPEFQGSVPALGMDLWLPVTQHAVAAPGKERLTERGWHWLEALARVKPGVSVAEARASFVIAYAQLASKRSRRADVVGTAFLLRDAEGGSVGLLRPVLLVLAAVAALVLLIACANLANLLLSRAVSRRRELAIRVSLGASRGALLRLLFLESVLLASAGGLAALLLTGWTAGLLVRFAPPNQAPILLNVPVDLHVLAFACALTAVTALIFGAAPALSASSGDLVGALKDGAPGGGIRRGRLRAALVVVQVSLSVVLLAAAGLCLRSLLNARDIDPGFQTSGVLLASLDLYPRANDAAAARALYRGLLERVGRAPGVTALTLAEDVPLGLESSSWTTVNVEGYQPARDERVSGAYNFVGPGYFRTLRTPVLRGRDFTAADDERSERVVIINQAMASRYWPGRDALGGRIQFWDEAWMRVVGIVADSHQRELTGRVAPFLAVPLLQFASEKVTLHVRTDGDPAALTGVVRDAVRAVDPAIPVFNIRTFTDHARAATFRQRMAGVLLSVFGVLALVLASVGVYGVLAFLVAQRTREFGVRLALGATAGDLIRLVTRQGLSLVGAGIAIGIAGALMTGPLLEDLLIGVGGRDPATLLGVVGILGIVALVACVLPARRATRVNPVSVLRDC